MGFPDSYTDRDVVYVWDEDQGVKFLNDVELSQFDLLSSPYRNTTIWRKKGDCNRSLPANTKIMRGAVLQRITPFFR